MTKEVKEHKSREQKRLEAVERLENKRNDVDQLRHLNRKKYRAFKERFRIAKRLNIPFEKTFSFDYSGSNSLLADLR